MSSLNKLIGMDSTFEWMHSPPQYVQYSLLFLSRVAVSIGISFFYILIFLRKTTIGGLPLLSIGKTGSFVYKESKICA